MSDGAVANQAGQQQLTQQAGNEVPQNSDGLMANLHVLQQSSLEPVDSVGEKRVRQQSEDDLNGPADKIYRSESDEKCEQMTEGNLHCAPRSALKARRIKRQAPSTNSAHGFSAKSGISFRNPGKRFKSESGSSAGDRNEEEKEEEDLGNRSSNTPVLPTLKSLAAANNKLRRLFKLSLDEWSSQSGEMEKGVNSNESYLSKVAAGDSRSLREAALEKIGNLASEPKPPEIRPRPSHKKSQFHKYTNAYALEGSDAESESS